MLARSFTQTRLACRSLHVENVCWFEELVTIVQWFEQLVVENGEVTGDLVCFAGWDCALA